MTLPEWLDEFGLSNAARLLNVPYRTACGWKYRGSLPSIKNIEKLVRASRGKLTYESIVKGQVKK